MQATVEFDPSYSLLTIDLSPGESIKAEPGAMVAQQSVAMATGMSGSGGLFGGIRRMMGGDLFS